MVVVVFVIACQPLLSNAEQLDTPTYDAHFHATFQPEKARVEANIHITQAAGELVWLEFSAPSTRYHTFKGDGEIHRQGNQVRWQVPTNGGALHYIAQIDSERSGQYDARITNDWAIVRLGDLFPPARSGAKGPSRSSLSMDAPKDWRIETPYGAMTRVRPVSNEARRYDRPTGWAIAGKLAVRRERIADRYVTIASPRHQGVRRQDLLAFLRWTLPDLVAVYPALPERLLIVSAGDPMWRGGLSGPASLYLHAQRPLISEDATSPPLHELIHVATRRPPEDGDDWIAEGLAEYYSLELLRRAGGISNKRFNDALEKMRERCAQEGGILSDPSTGINSTRALLLFYDLDIELQNAGSGLDTLVSLLSSGSRLSRGGLNKAATSLLQGPSESLGSALLEKN